MTSQVLYLFGSAAPPVLQLPGVVRQAQAAGWQVCVGLTPTAARWLGEDLPLLEELTGHPVRREYKLPGEPDVWPGADAILFAPATFNSLNQWALGLTEKFVVGVVAEAIGEGIPTVAMACMNAAAAEHPQFAMSVETLGGAGVTVLYGESGFMPDQPGDAQPGDEPWDLALAAVRTAAGGTS